MALVLVILFFLAIKIADKNALSDEDYGYKFDETNLDNKQNEITSNEN